MTSRIQEDGDGKEAKWADIDDDEDDWAPTTIEWNDGTKSTVPPVEAVPTTEEKPKMDLAPLDEPKQSHLSKAVAPQFISSVGPNAKVLKVGANAEKQQAQKAIAQQPRGPVEKASTGSSKTAPAPVPAKSPWASLPPVDKISPVVINPQPLSLAQKYPGSFGYSSLPNNTAPSPAKEISADDFSRSWREIPVGHSRELYMPNSGKYETVPEPRRRMSKSEGFRNTTVLQRPSQAEQHPPAEPSPAFQTTRTSIDQARRRASSNLSGGSGQFGRRMSLTKSSETGLTPVDVSQPTQEMEELDLKEGSPLHVQPTAYQARGPSPTAQILGENAVLEDLERQRAQQKLMMREQAEQARRRRLEEEERMEAEKRERIRLKLAALGPAPQLQKDQKDPDTEAEKTTQPTRATIVNPSPPKPPQPLATGEPQQYGMMKVHPLDSVKRHGLQPNHSPGSMEPPKASAIAPPATQFKEPQKDEGQLPTPTVNGTGPSSDSQKTSSTDAPSIADRSPQPAKAVSAGPDVRAGWADVKNNRIIQGGSVWGLPNNKALGNGTFDQAFTGYLPHDLSRNGLHPSQAWPEGTAPLDRSPQPPFTNSSLPENRQQLHMPSTSPDQYSLAANSEVDSLQPMSKPAPIAPPQPQYPAQNWQTSPSLSQAAGGLAAWNNFHQVASQQEQAENDRIQRELMARRDEEMRTGVRAGPQYVFNETWKQVQLDEQAGQRQVSNVAQATVPPSNIFGAVGSMAALDSNMRPLNGFTSRGSRFFPATTDGTTTQARRAVTYSVTRTSQSPSPPPAEEFASHHPAFDGDLRNPVVHFPREKAVVKLPPMTAQPQEAPIEEDSLPLTWAARVSQPAPQPSLRVVSLPIAQTPSWQARFDGLLGKSPSKLPSQPTQVGLTVASKETFDALPEIFTASVSLPQKQDIKLLEEAETTTSKDVEDEEDLFEDREAGSLPAIKMPREMLPHLFTRMHHAGLPRPTLVPVPIDPTSVIKPLFVNNWTEKRHYPPKDLYALVRFPGSTKATKHMLAKGVTGSVSDFLGQPRSHSATFSNKASKYKGPKSRQVSETQARDSGSRPSSGTSSQTQSQGRSSAPNTQPASPLPGGNIGAAVSSNKDLASSMSAADSDSQRQSSQLNGHLRAPRHFSHSHHRGNFKVKSPHNHNPHPQAQTAH